MQPWSHHSWTCRLRHSIPSKELQERLQQLGHQHITRIVEWSLPHPADENGNIGGEKRDKDQSKRLGSGSSTLRRSSLIYWVWTLSVDRYGLLFLERSRLWRLAKTVIVCLVRVDRSVKKHVFLWTIPKMCEMTAIDWQYYPNAREINHLCYLEIIRPVENGEVKLLIGNDHYEELLVPLKHHIVNRTRSEDTTRMINCWICVVGSSKRVPCCYPFPATFTPKMWANELMPMI